MAVAGKEDSVKKAKAALLSGIEDAQKALLDRLRANGLSLDLPLPGAPVASAQPQLGAAVTDVAVTPAANGAAAAAENASVAPDDGNSCSGAASLAAAGSPNPILFGGLGGGRRVLGSGSGGSGLGTLGGSGLGTLGANRLGSGLNKGLGSGLGTRLGSGLGTLGSGLGSGLGGGLGTLGLRALGTGRTGPQALTLATLGLLRTSPAAAAAFEASENADFGTGSDSVQCAPFPKVQAAAQAQPSSPSSAPPNVSDARKSLEVISSKLTPADVASATDANSDGEPKTALELLAAAAIREEAAKKDNAVINDEASKKRPAQPTFGYAQARAATIPRRPDLANEAADMASGSRLSGGAQSSSDAEKKESCCVYFSSVPRGTGQGLIRAKAEKFGQISHIECHTDPVEIFGDRWALVSFVEPSMAEAAVKRLSKQSGLFGATAAEPVEVRLANDDEARELLASVGNDQPVTEAAVTAPEAAPYLAALSGLSGLYDERETENRHRSRSRSKRRRPPLEIRSRSRRRRSPPRERRRNRRQYSYDEREEDRYRRQYAYDEREEDRYRRRQHSYDEREEEDPDVIAGQSQLAMALQREPIDAAEDRKARLSRLGGFDNSDQQVANSRSGANDANAAPSGGRQIGVRGEWAQFAVSNGRHYFKNLVSGECRWDMPTGFMQQSTKLTKETFGAAPNRSKIFVSHIPSSWDEDQLSQRFNQFGQIANAQVLRDDSGASRYCGFVAFMEEAAAQAALSSMDGYFVGSSRLKVVPSRF